ncbi:MAG: hypothetical protein AVDCRST_MAG91-3816 [uncultured Sphingomonadaceae bacterium]|uniref:DUF3857 domain-containing protein n=1 Tax=uncultured Sphingomonadaceae bacterium TaxID=169976 RepID=A0A6J4U4J8_9SPHN|nr:MAG: hypothetical protein AVDCRST_MAG91-3816 [uncultured Sphingomonadaceae bacterium]
MGRRIAALAAMSVLSGAAWAADKPVIAPAPAWVRPVPQPPAAAKADEAPFRVLLSDQQVALEPGRQTVYTDVALKIQTTQGLEAGNVSLPWRPDTDVLTVHKLVIRRGAETVDVLKSGQQFTVARREPNMERAMLDGVLTANIQPEGLQVGDVLEFAASVSSADPTLKAHAEHLGAAWNGVPIGRAHLRVQWPGDMPVRVRATPALPAITPVKSGDLNTVELTLDDVQPLAPPKGAPARYAIGRLVEFTGFRSWSDLGALMAPLYVKASAMPAAGPLRVEIDRIRRSSASPRARVEAALALVQDRVRYVALAMGTGGLVPADAEETWSRRYGDCKAKTALLLGLLRELGVEAEPVAVSTVFGDGLDQRLPMVGLFDHVLVRAVVSGRTYWLDGTRTGDNSLDRLKTPNFGWGLPLVPTRAALVRMVPAPLDAPTQVTTIRIDARAGLTVPAPATVEKLFRGDEALAVKLGLANLTGEARERGLREYWRDQYDFIDAEAVDASFDPKTGEQRLTLKGKARMDWKDGWYETDGVGIGYKADFSRDPGPHRDAPFAVAYPFYNKVVETILLPPGFDKASAGSKADVDRTVAGIHYRRNASVTRDTFTIEMTESSVAPEFPFAEAASAQATLRDLADSTVYLRRPAAYRPTEAEVTVAMSANPTTAEALFERGLMLMDRGRMDEAISDFNRADALKPKHVWTLANRGLARVWKGDEVGAARDLDAAAALDGRNPVLFRARGLLAARQNRPKDAVAAFATALEIEPANAFVLGHKALAERAAGNDDVSLRDAAAALKLNPKWPDLYLMRANIYRNRGARDQALAEADAMTAADPENTYAFVAAANVYSEFGRTDDAMRAYDRALAIKPEPYIYINRAMQWPRHEVAKKRNDFDAALRLDPTSGDALEAKARFLAETDDHAGAVAAYTAALKAHPDDPILLAERGVAYARKGDTAEAERDFAAARAKAVTAAALNAICWNKATAGVSLESALADCDGALKKSPDAPAILDSRGLVLLRLGRFDEAIATYDRALAKNPAMSTSLFGRAVARARKGDPRGSEADLKKALEANADVRDEFEGHGVRL